MEKKKLLIVVDYQKDFVDGALGFPKAVTLEDGIYTKATEYLKNGDIVLITKDAHDEDYLKTREGKNLPVVHCRVDTPGYELYGKVEDLAKNEAVLVLTKRTFAMKARTIQRLIDNMYDKYNITDIEFVGVVTDICVISNVVIFQTVFKDANIIVDASLCASFDDKKHEAALDVMESLQVKVINRH